MLKEISIDKFFDLEYDLNIPQTEGTSRLC